MATAQLAEALGERLPLVYSAVIILALSLAAQYLFRSDPLASLPYVGEELGNEAKRRTAYLTDCKSLYMQGYKKFKNTLFKITTPSSKDVVVVPIEYLDELKKLPDTVLSFSKAIEDLMATKYTKLLTDDETIVHTVKGSLTPALFKINPVLTEEVARAIRDEMPACPDWTEVNINQKLLRIVAIVSGRIFLGPELCHDERYIDAAIQYTVELSNARTAVMELRPWLRRFRAPFLPEVRRLEERQAEFFAILEPIVHARREAERSDPNYVKPDDMLQWLLDTKDKDMGGSGGSAGIGDQYLAQLQLNLSFAAIHTTTMTATNAFYDLAANPGVVAELREECSAVLAENGGVFTSQALQNLKKLDSCLKESLRMSPPGFASFTRKVLQTFTLSNGQVIPAGTMVEVPAYPQSRDPGPYPEPDRWDGLRFYRMRQAAESFNSTGDNKATTAVQANAHNQFVSVSHRSLTFGYGRHACPGRFFAANEIKMIMARALLQYDFKLAGGATERYPNFEFAGALLPDPTKTLLFREVR